MGLTVIAWKLYMEKTLLVQFEGCRIFPWKIGVIVSGADQFFFHNSKIPIEIPYWGLTVIAQVCHKVK